MIRLAVIAGVIVLALMGAGFLVNEEITTSAFDRVEAAAAAQQAQQLVTALDGEIRLLSEYGVTNSIWDDSYQSVRDGDAEAFVAIFPPGEVHRLYGLDGVLGVAPDGSLRTGGMVAGEDEFAPLPQALDRPEVLTQLYPASGEPGETRCGTVALPAAPVIFCGLRSYDSDSAGDPVGGLIFLKSMDATELTRLGDQSALRARLVGGVRDGGNAQRARKSLVGSVTVATTALTANRLAIDVVVPAIDGGKVTMEVVTDRPIHQVAIDSSLGVLAVMLTAGLLLLVVLLVLVVFGIRAQVNPLRRTATDVITSGDWSLRVDTVGRGEIAKLGALINRMLDVLDAKTAEAERAHVAREREMGLAVERQREAEERALADARAILDESSALVAGPLSDVVDRAGAVRAAVDQIGDQVAAATRVTEEVIGQAGATDDVLAALGEHLRRVAGVAQLINTLAAQTKLLALNATIEASRAGEAGAGFNVVANEVKTLAASTATSTDEIAGTIGALRESATAAAATLSAMTDGLTGIADATAAIGQATQRQRSAMLELDAQVGQALSSARQLTHR